MIYNNKIVLTLFAWIVSFWVFMAIAPLDRHDWIMENILFIGFFTLLVTTYRKFTLSNASYVLIAIYLTLHIIGSHYTYSKVPFGFFIADIFDIQRNHFDRIVHFSFGLLLTYPIRELLVRITKVKGFMSFYLPVDIVLAFSGLFEIIEWLFVLQVNPELGEAYLGMQGDVWDAQKDMALATIGAVIAMIFSFILIRKSSSNQ